MLRLSLLFAIVVGISLGGIVNRRADSGHPFCKFLPVYSIGEAIFGFDARMKENTKLGESIAEFQAEHNVDVSIYFDEAANKRSEYFMMKFTTEGSLTNVSLRIKKSISEDYDEGKFVDGDRFTLHIVCKGKADNLEPVKLMCNIVIEATNDYAPTFKKLKYSATIEEDFPVNYAFREKDMETIFAYDKDRLGSDHSKITFSVLDAEHHAESDTFFVEGKQTKDILSTYTVTFSLKQHLDYEVRTEYKLVLEAKDSSLNTTCDITIHVVDVDDKDPVFSQSVYTATVKKDMISEDRIGIESNELIRAEDGDRGIMEKILYTLDESRSDYPKELYVNNSNTDPYCQVALKNSTKLVEDGVTYFVAVILGKQKNNPMRSGSTMLKVRLEIPDFTTTDMTTTEQSTILTTTELSTSDYTTTEQLTADTATTSSNSAERTTQPTTESTSPVTTLPDTDTSLDGITFTTTGTVPNENQGFKLSEYNFILSSTQEINKTVYTVRAGDAATYEIEDEEDYFFIDPTTGAIALLKNIDGKVKLRATVFALVDGHRVDNATINVLVIKGATEIRFPQPLYEFSVEENTEQTLPILSVNHNSLARYKILTGDANKFVLDDKTAELKITSKLDFEEKSLYVLRVKIYLNSEKTSEQNSESNERDHGPVKDDEALVVVKVSDVNEAPQFDHATEPLRVGVASFHKPGQTYQLEQAEDVDEGDNGKLKYSLLNGSAAFDILPGSGNLKLLKERPEEKLVSLKLVAQDGGTPSLKDTFHFEVFFLKDDELFTITVTLTERTKRTPRAYSQPHHQSIFKTFADVLNVKVGLVQSDWNADDSTRTDLCLFAQKDKEILNFDTIRQMLKDKHSELEKAIGPYDINIPKALATRSNEDDSEPSATVVAVYVLSGVVFAMVAAALGLFIFYKWSNASKHKAADTVDNGAIKADNQKIDDASEAILNNEFQKILEVSEEPAAQIYSIDTNDRTQLIQVIESADGGIENPLAQLSNEPINTTDIKEVTDEPNTHSLLHYEIKEVQNAVDGSPKRLIKAWPTLSPFTDSEETNAITPVETTGSDHKLTSVAENVQLTATTHEGEVDLAANTETVDDIGQCELESYSDNDDNTNEELSSDTKPLKKCLKTETDPQPTRRKSIVTFNETAEVITEEIVIATEEESCDL